MGRSSVLVVLSALALSVYVNAHPCAKVGSCYQLGEGFTSKKSSSSSSSNSFNQANEENIEINGVHNGQTFAGSKVSGYSSSGGSHSSSSAYSSASVNGAVPIGLIPISASSSAFVNSGAQDDAIKSQFGSVAHQNGGILNIHQGADVVAINNAAAGYDQNSKNVGSGQFQGITESASSSQQTEHGAQGENVAGDQYWWIKQNNPFVQSGSPPSGCNSNGCSAGGSINISNKGSDVGFGSASSGVAGNNGYAFGSASSGAFSYGHQAGGIAASKNPFFNGAGFSSGSAASHGSAGHDSGSSGGSGSGLGFGSTSSGASGNGFAFGGASSGSSPTDQQTVGIVASKNPFLNGAGFSSGSSATHGSASHESGSSSVHGSGNEFAFGAASSGSTPSDQQTVGIVASKNPFLSGTGFSSGSSVIHGSGSHDSGSSSVHGSGSSGGSGSGIGYGTASSGISGNGFAFGATSSGSSPSDQQTIGVVASKNPFFNGAGFSSGSSATHGSGSHQSGSSSVHGSGNEFAFGPASSGSPSFNQQTGGTATSKKPFSSGAGFSSGSSATHGSASHESGSSSVHGSGSSGGSGSGFGYGSSSSGASGSGLTFGGPSSGSSSYGQQTGGIATSKKPFSSGAGFSSGSSAAHGSNSNKFGSSTVHGSGSLGGSGSGFGYGSSSSGASGSGFAFGADSSGSSSSGQHTGGIGTSKKPFSSGPGFSSGSSATHGSGSHQSGSSTIHGSGSSGGSGSGFGYGSSSSGASGSGFAFGANSSGSSSSGQQTGGIATSKKPFSSGPGFSSGSSATHGSGSHQSGSSGGSGSGFGYGSSSSGASGSGFAFGADSSGSSSSGQQTGGIATSKKPFSSGPGFSSGSSATHGTASHGSGQSGSSFVHTSGSQIPTSPSSSSTSSIVGQKRPQIPSVPSSPSFQQTTHRQENIFGQQETGAFPSFTGTGQIHREQSSATQGGLSVSCNGQNKICVAKHLCTAAGYVITKDLTQVRTGPQNCNVNSEVCCTLKSFSSDDNSAGSHSIGHSTVTTNFGNRVVNSGQKNGGVFGNANVNHEQIDLSAGEAGLFANSNQAQDNNGYLPPLGSEPSSNIPAFSKPPVEEQPDKEVSNSDNPPISVPPPQLGCAAALICVEEQFCTMDGTISPKPIALSSEQLIRRVPLSRCKNPDNGVIGMCCRDPNYVDPWPAGNLPANYSGGFDEQGFPTFLNIAKTRPPKKQPTQATKGARTIKTSFSSIPQVNSPPRTPTLPQIQNEPTRISNTFNQISNNGPKKFHAPREILHNQVQNSPASFPQFPAGNPITQSTHIVPKFSNVPSKPNVPIVSHTNRPHVISQPSLPDISKKPNQPEFSSLPNTPSRPNFNGVKTVNHKNNYDTSSSNENPTVIQSYLPGSQCGRKNKVQRPDGLTDVDAAFGEIPWQAMILLNTEKRLLCSGAIVAPNAVIVAANCVEGYNPSVISVKVGEWKLGYELKHEEPLPFEIIEVASIVPYPEYNPGSAANDVAILLLEHNMKLDQHVDTICLPQGQPQLPQPERKCISTGWGKVILQVHAAGALMHRIDVDMLSNEECQERLNDAESPIDLDDSLVCTKAHKQNNNMCQVDPGGPLACDRGDGYYELVGVYNQDTGCLPTNQVATFAKINTSWVQEILSNPPQVNIDESVSSTLTSQQPIVHKHGSKVCVCQKDDLPEQSESYEYHSPE